MDPARSNDALLDSAEGSETAVGVSEPPHASAWSWVEHDGPIQRWVVRQRRVLFLVVVVLMALAFNGQWRMGRDSAVYRQLGHNLVEGRGYTYHGQAHDLSHPGLPVMLGACEAVFGQAAWPPLVLIWLAALATLWLVHQTLAMRFPPWVAVAVTFLTGLSGSFVVHSVEILTDIPFLAAVSLLWWGLERFQIAATRKQSMGAIVTMAAALLLAMAFRPTFWIVLVALVLVAGFSIRRAPWAWWVLGAVLVVMGLWVLIDPRGGSGMIGSYDRVLDSGFHRLLRPWMLWDHAVMIAEDALPRGLFGFELGPGVNSVAGMLLIGGLLGLLFCRPIWALTAFGLLVVSLLIGPSPRYFLMVQPILLLAWVGIWSGMARRIKHPTWSEVLLGFGLLVAALPNLGRTASVAWEQRQTPFYDHFQDGKLKPMIAICDTIRDKIPADARVIGPDSGIMTYLADQPIQTPYWPFHRKIRGDWPKYLARQKHQYIVLPADLYRHTEPALYELIHEGVIVPLPGGYEAGGAWVGPFEIQDTAAWQTHAAGLDAAGAPLFHTRRYAGVKGQKNSRRKDEASREQP